MRLILYAENNKTSINNNINSNRITYKRDYESELKKCIESWRTNGGYLKDIPITVFYNNLNNFYNNGNIEYIELKLNHNDYGFLNVHFAGLEAQKLYPNDTLIHIDLDMYLKKPLPEKILLSTTIGVYAEEEFISQREKLFGEHLAETDLIITTPGSDFYTNYFKHYDNIVKLLKMKKKDPYDYEEYVADYVLNKYKYNTFSYYECGEGFNYQGPYYFWHEHMRLNDS